MRPLTDRPTATGLGAGHSRETVVDAAKQLPTQVLSPLTQLLGYLAWCVLLLCIARAVWVGGLLAIRSYREESIEGLIGALLGAALLGSASSLALAVLPST
ncbi:hypothetical protein [Nocardia noduli]|uniref:hypothetical protein n=1 Tax=Nocardia noduli TaxID=2815722 RepID=UPI001C217FAE|nr:hypothetical protein [Nocardia noduli]